MFHEVTRLSLEQEIKELEARLSILKSKKLTTPATVNARCTVCGEVGSSVNMQKVSRHEYAHQSCIGVPNMSNEQIITKTIRIDLSYTAEKSKTDKFTPERIMQRLKIYGICNTPNTRCEGEVIGVIEQ